jgi:hypothetical protein
MSEKTALPIAQAMGAIMREVGAIAKKDKNTSQGFNFRGIDSVVNAVSPALQKYGVIVVPTVEDYEYTTVEIGRNRTAMGHVKVKVTYTFIGANSDAIKATVVGEAMDAGDKATAKAMSVAFRTALLQALALPTDEPDPDTHSYERSSADDVISPSAILLKLTSAIDVNALAEVGQYITANKNGYSAEQVENFRIKFREQQLKLSPPKFEESNDESSIEDTKTDIEATV